MYLHRLIFLLLFYLGSGAAHAQEDEYTFMHYSTSSGLLSSQIFAITQDAEGFIWLGTTDGLQRYDGVRYLSFSRRSTQLTSAPTTGVSQLVMDKKNRLWVLLFDGTVGIFDTRHFQFNRKEIEVQSPDALKSTIRRLTLDDSGNIFLLFQGREILTWNEEAQKFSYRFNFFPIPPNRALSGFEQRPGTQEYWMGIQNGGFAVYDKATKQFSYTNHNKANVPMLSMLDSNVSSAQMKFDHKGRLWFYYWKSVNPIIYCYDFKTQKIKTFDLLDRLHIYHEIRDFMIQSDGTVWVYGHGIFARYDEQLQDFVMVRNGYTSEHSISFEAVTCLFEDNRKNVWVGTNTNGLFSFNPSVSYFTNVGHENQFNKGVGRGSPMSFVRTKWNTMLVGVWEDGLMHYDKNMRRIPFNIAGIKEKNNLLIWDLTASKDSISIWMGGQPGIYRINQDEHSFKFYNPPALKQRTVRQVVEDKQGNLWLGMHAFGLYCWKIGGVKDPSTVVPERISYVPNHTISQMILDREGLLWVASDGGVYVIDPKTGKRVFHSSPIEGGNLKLPELPASSVLDYSDSLVFISQADNIIQYSRKTKSTIVKFQSGTFSGNISNLERDDNGFLWVATTNGLYRLNPFSKIMLQFTKEDGIQNTSFINASSMRHPDGRLFFGNTNQFIYFRPSDIKIDPAIPNIKVTGVDVMNESLNLDSLMSYDKVSLPYNKNSLTIYFSPMSYDISYLVQYQLEGLDKEWRTADNRMQGTYSYLPVGTYTLRFRAMNWEGKFRESQTQLIIRIKPAFWQSWWFRSLIALCVIGLFLWLDRERMSRKESLQEMRSTIADNLHEDINTALNNINILSAMARQKADTEPEKSKEFIEQIHNKSHNMIIALDDMLWSISPENDRMEKTVERMQEYIDALNIRHDAGIAMLVDEKVKALKLDMEFRHEAFWLFKESIYSLVKAGVTKANIHVALDKSYLQYTVQFNNESSDMQQLNNLFQRQDMQTKLEDMKAKRNITLHRSHSLLEIKLPVNK